MSERTCATCGAGLTPNPNGGRPWKYCPACRPYRGGDRPALTTCPRCGTEFDREKTNRKYCSEKCRVGFYRDTHVEHVRVYNQAKIAQRRLEREAKRAAEGTPICYRNCLECDCLLVSPVNRIRLFGITAYPRFICSPRCKMRRASRQANPERKRQQRIKDNAKASASGKRAEWQRTYRQTPKGHAATRARSKWRRAQTRGAKVVESFDSHEVFERDGWKCHLCRKRINPKLKNPHPKSASLDHIIPLTVGGEHSLANSATAHLDCNMAKSNGAANDQLRLIG